MLGFGVDANELDHGKLRNGETLATGFHDQRRDDGERQRNLDGEAEALALHRLHVDAAADLIDVVANHIHADAAAGHAGDLLGGREAGREDELLDLGFRHLVELGLGDEPVGQSLFLDPLDVEAAAVIGDADDDMPALVIGGQPDDALLRLASGDPVGPRLQAVVGGVAHHVGERILDALQHLAVELGVGAVQLELDVLAELGGKIADDARQLLPSVADRLHARAHDAVLQLGGNVGEPLQRHLELGIVVAAHDVEELVAGQHQLGHHGHQVFERVDADANRFAGDRGLGFFLLGPVGILGLAVLGAPCAARP